MESCGVMLEVFRAAPRVRSRVALRVEELDRRALHVHEESVQVRPVQPLVPSTREARGRGVLAVAARGPLWLLAAARDACARRNGWLAAAAAAAAAASAAHRLSSRITLSQRAVRLSIA